MTKTIPILKYNHRMADCCHNCRYCLESREISYNIYICKKNRDNGLGRVESTNVCDMYKRGDWEGYQPSDESKLEDCIHEMEVLNK